MEAEAQKFLVLQVPVFWQALSDGCCKALSCVYLLVLLSSFRFRLNKQPLTSKTAEAIPSILRRLILFSWHNRHGLLLFLSVKTFSIFTNWSWERFHSWKKSLLHIYMYVGWSCFFFDTIYFLAMYLTRMGSLTWNCNLHRALKCCEASLFQPYFSSEWNVLLIIVNKKVLQVCFGWALSYSFFHVIKKLGTTSSFLDNICRVPGNRVMRDYLLNENPYMYVQREDRFPAVSCILRDSWIFQGENLCTEVTKIRTTMSSVFYETVSCRACIRFYLDWGCSFMQRRNNLSTFVLSWCFCIDPWMQKFGWNMASSSEFVGESFEHVHQNNSPQWCTLILGVIPPNRHLHLSTWNTDDWRHSTETVVTCLSRAKS